MLNISASNYSEASLKTDNLSLGLIGLYFIELPPRLFRFLQALASVSLVQSAYCRGSCQNGLIRAGPQRTFWRLPGNLSREGGSVPRFGASQLGPRGGTVSLTSVIKGLGLS